MQNIQLVINSIVLCELVIVMLKGTVHSSNIWAKSLANGSLMIVL